MPYNVVTISCPQEFVEILIAELVQINYDSFQELDDRLEAYVEKDLFDEIALKSIIAQYNQTHSISYTFAELEEKNWNEEWEKNFNPVFIADKCIVRASFHQPNKKYLYDIIINPKMSFGTGHHETTSMMLEHQLEIDHKGKLVLDAGTGTGVLAIMACKLGASFIEAYDIDNWAFENLKENINLNDCLNISIYQGTISTISLKEKSYDILLANINRNILLAEMAFYAKKIKQRGFLVLSGFYVDDIPVIEKSANQNGLVLERMKENNKWASLVFIKK